MAYALWDLLLLLTCWAGLSWWVAAIGLHHVIQPSILGIVLPLAAVVLALVDRWVRWRRPADAVAAAVPVPVPAIPEVPETVLTAARHVLASLDPNVARPTRAWTMTEIEVLDEELAKYPEGHVDAGFVLQGNDLAVLGIVMSLMLHPALRAKHADPVARLKHVHEAVGPMAKVPRYTLMRMVRNALCA